MTAAQRVQDQLDRWATMTPDEIAADLEARGIKGHATRCSDCPVALALTRVADTEGVKAKVDEIAWWLSSEMFSADGKLPATVIALVSRIDRGFYPELEA